MDFPSFAREIDRVPSIVRRVWIILPRQMRWGIPSNIGSTRDFARNETCTPRLKWAEAQSRATGHAPHNGLRDVQIVAPRSMSA
jgi:hypothetical protein